MSVKLDSANETVAIDISAFTAKDYVAHVAKIMKGLVNNGLDYSASIHLNALVGRTGENPKFSQKHADWVYQNHKKAFELLKKPIARKVFQYLRNAEENGDVVKSINKLRRDLKTHPQTLWRVLNEFRDISLLESSESGKGESIQLKLNLKEYEVIIRALNIVLIDL